MLVIERYDQERIVIGKAGDVLTESIVITVAGFRQWTEASRLRVRLAISAQRDVGIVREELLTLAEEITES